MQIFLPYKDIFETAKCLDNRRLNKQIIECRQILDAIDGAKAWCNHPIINMYKCNSAFVRLYMKVLEEYIHGYIDNATRWSDFFNKYCCFPHFITDDYCDQMKRRLYTKDPIYYKQFEKYGKSDVNWYFVEGKWLYYKKGKQININE